MAIGVDMQNDFCPGGSLAVPYGDEVIAPFNTLTRAVRGIGGLVAFSRDWHPPKTSHFNTWPPHCIAGTNGAEFHKDLEIEKDDIIISKGMQVDEDNYSAFEGFAPDGNTLESLIRAELERVQHLYVAIGGLATDYCDKATVLSGLELREAVGPDRLTIIALKSCMRAVNIDPNDGQRALDEMQAAGALLEMPKGLLL